MTYYHINIPKLKYYIHNCMVLLPTWRLCLDDFQWFIQCVRNCFINDLDLGRLQVYVCIFLVFSRFVVLYSFLPVIAIFGRCHGRLWRWSFWGWTSSRPIWIRITGVSRTNYGGTSCHFDFLQRKNTKVRHYLTAKQAIVTYGLYVRSYVYT